MPRSDGGKRVQMREILTSTSLVTGELAEQFQRAIEIRPESAKGAPLFHR